MKKDQLTQKNYSSRLRLQPLRNIFFMLIAAVSAVRRITPRQCDAYDQEQGPALAMAAATATGPLCSHRADWVARVARELLGSVASKLEAVFKASLIARAYDFARVFDNQSRPSFKPSPAVLFMLQQAAQT